MTLTAQAHVAIHRPDCWNTNHDRSLWKSLKTSQLSNLRSTCLYIQAFIPLIKVLNHKQPVLVLPREHMFSNSGSYVEYICLFHQQRSQKREGNPLFLLMCLPSSFDWCVACQQPLSSEMLLSRPFTVKWQQHSKNNIYLTQNFRLWKANAKLIRFFGWSHWTTVQSRLSAII